MKLSEWAESFKIMGKYSDEDNVVQAEHDEIIAGPEDGFACMTTADTGRLQELGWLENEYGGLIHFT